MIGQILDGKYKIDKQLGKGGMGTVYLSTHIGTARPVAVKVIAPDFMKRSEFVERFRREAKAAGRLRHPNVVDVTDFGFGKTENGDGVAYLVMEYLDGCTLGEVLDEEKKLPLSFTIDILEQVSSAIEEAHRQGIIHRDLKPDNIWLEPNLRGGFTVKVLDFGIAKLEESQISEAEHEIENPGISNLRTEMIFDNKTIADENQLETLTDKKNGSTIISENETVALVENIENPVSEKSEAGTLIQPIQADSQKSEDSEDKTAIFPANQTRAIEAEDLKGTKIISDLEQTDKSLTKTPLTTNLTKVGAVLGTPLYMSPEQCRGEKLTNRSDIYSLAVIVYQMLSGNLPFTGDYLNVMEGHKTAEPPPIIAKKVPKKLKSIVMQALSKDSEERPVTAEAFASKIRASSEGIGSLLRRSLTIYSENLPKILLLTFLTFLPLIILTAVRVFFGIATGLGFIEDENLKYLYVGFEIFNFFLSIVMSAFLVGMMTWVVAQYLAYPLRPLSLRSAFDEAKRKAKSLSLTVGLSTIISLAGFVLCLIPGFIFSALFMMIAPSIMMEGVKGKAAFKRSIELTKRSFRTVLATSILVYVIPFILGAVIASFIGLANTTYVQSLRVSNMKSEMETMKKEGVKPQPQNEKKDEKETNIIVIGEGEFSFDSDDSDSDNAVGMNDETKKSIRKFSVITQSLSQLVLLPSILLLASITSVITALLYFKTRQAGGESMQELLGKLDETELPQSKWQQRVRERLIQSGKITGTTNPSKSNLEI